MNLKDYIATIENYPKEGITFRDISPLMADGNAYSYAVREIVQYATDKKIDMIVGPEAPLVNGVVDAAREAGLKIWGPTQYAAQLEGSKAFAKHFLKRHNIPTAFYEVFTEVDAAKAMLKKMAHQL